MQPFLGEEEAGAGESLSHAACHLHPAPPARQTRPAASARSLSAAEGRLGALRPSCPAEPRVALGQHTALRGLRLTLLSSPHAPLPHWRSGGGGKGAERHTGRGTFLSFLSSADLIPPLATYALNRNTSRPFLHTLAPPSFSPEEPGGRSGGERVAPATSYLVVGGLPGGGVVVKEG